MPDELPEAVFQTLRNNFPDQAALWLRLVPPYGYLGAVPWEEKIIRSDLPLLRVPNRLPAATDPGQAWSVAIAIDAVPGASWVAPYVTSLVTALRTVVESTVDIHVFADAASHDAIRHALSRIPDGNAVHLPEPGSARGIHLARSKRDVKQFRGTRQHTVAPSPETHGLLWADWIAAGLRGKAVRALHADEKLMCFAAQQNTRAPITRGTPTTGSRSDQRPVLCGG